MTIDTVDTNLSAYLAHTATSLDAAVFVGGSLLGSRYDELLRATQRGVRMRFLLGHPGIGWLDEIVLPAGFDPRQYAQRMHVNASRALMLGDTVEVRWQPFPIPWWFVISDHVHVYLKAINLAGRPPAIGIKEVAAVAYFKELFASAWARAEPASPASPSLPPGPAKPAALRAFLCHACEDKVRVRSLYQDLLADGVSPWLDEENLIPGQEWELEITRAIRQSDVVLICLSQTAIAKRGFVQRELRVALEVADEMPKGTIFLVPVRLEPCEVPGDLERLHRVDLFDPKGHALLSRALRVVKQR